MCGGTKYELFTKWFNLKLQYYDRPSSLCEAKIYVLLALLYLPSPKSYDVIYEWPLRCSEVNTWNFESLWEISAKDMSMRNSASDQDCSQLILQRFIVISV